YFVGGAGTADFGHASITQALSAPVGAVDFSGLRVGSGVPFNLGSTADQRLVAGTDASKLWLKLNSGSVIKDVIGTQWDDTLTGNGLDNLMMGAALPGVTSDGQSIDRTVPAGVTRAVTTQWVYLDFNDSRIPYDYDSPGNFVPANPIPGYDPAKYTYTQADKTAILAGLQTIFAPFGSLFQFTMNRSDIPSSVGDNFVPIPVNVTPFDDTTNSYFAGGKANETDFRNLNQHVTDDVDINGSLGSLPGQPRYSKQNC